MDASVSYTQRLKSLLDFSVLEKPIQKHVKNVYSCLTLGFLFAALGSYLYLIAALPALLLSDVVVSLGSVAFMLAVIITEHRPDTMIRRLFCFCSMAFCMGLRLGPLLNIIIQINPTIVTTSLMSTSLIFICFTLSALLNTKRSFLYLGGFLGSMVTLLLITSIYQIFAQNQTLFTVELYVALVVFSLFVLYDTQLMVEKRRMGDTDYIRHSIDLFIDFVGLFRIILTILGRKEES